MARKGNGAGQHCFRRKRRGHEVLAVSAFTERKDQVTCSSLSAFSSYSAAIAVRTVVVFRSEMAAARRRHLAACTRKPCTCSPARCTAALAAGPISSGVGGSWRHVLIGFVQINLIL